MDKSKFASFAILDFETSNLPHMRGNKVGITELSVFGCSIQELRKNNEVTTEEIQLPRVLHKLTLMIYPRMRIDPEGEKITGLSNIMLEKESPFNENAANTLISFLRHLQQPVCLVAHNGYNFDFPILKYVMERISMTMPEDLYCLDSLRAFHDIDLHRQLIIQNDIENDLEEITKIENKEPLKDTNLEPNIEAVEVKIEKNFDARAQNETTPKRPITGSSSSKSIKRNRNSDSDNEDSLRESKPKSRRCLNFNENCSSPSLSTTKRSSGQRWYPPKNKYKLGNIYRGIFQKDPVQLHNAEADASLLTKLMLHYGQDFVDYAEKYAILLKDVPKLGSSCYL